MSTCQVLYCRYPETHITERHCCGTCKQGGHGQMECGKLDEIELLKRFTGEIIENFCDISGCIDPYTHTTDGHSCLYCNKRCLEGDIQSNIKHLNMCPLHLYNRNNICDNLDKFHHEMIENIKEVKLSMSTYKSVFGSMGSIWYIRNNAGIHEYLFMHSDSWGQYGEDSSDLPRYNAFKYGYKLVE